MSIFNFLLSSMLDTIANIGFFAHVVEDGFTNRLL
jgi:hypothetical protein